MPPPFGRWQPESHQKVPHVSDYPTRAESPEPSPENIEILLAICKVPALTCPVCQGEGDQVVWVQCCTQCKHPSIV